MPQVSPTYKQRVRYAIRALFAISIFLDLFYSQRAALFLAQHQLSGGATTYHPFLGALILTVLLLVVQRGVDRLFPFGVRFYPLTFFPSALVLVLLTAFTPSMHLGALILSLILAGLWLFLAFSMRAAGRNRRENYEASHLTLAVTSLMVLAYMGLCGNSNDVLTYEVRAARAIRAADCEEALRVGEKSLWTSRILTAERAFAMTRCGGGLAETLFTYPLPSGGSSNLFFAPADTALTLLSPDSLYYRLRLRPRYNEKASSYFNRAARSFPHSVARDYRLCALLLDRDLETFARELPRYYTVSDSVVLPRFYAQAMILYVRTAANPVAVYTDPNVAANYRDFREKGRGLTSRVGRRSVLWREYGDTYWWYYFYNDEPSLEQTK